ncbi:MAG: type II toxin-antitoxin system VapC family toxin [Ahniella sp.]|nr:type II toxin-antitoxin system VapC family toxin [Ahniella sp.]
MYLLDTNVVSELRKVRSGKADMNVARWAEQSDAALLFISVVTVQEIELGILLAERKDPAQGSVFRTWFNDQVLPAFANRILSVDVTIALRSAALHAVAPRPVRDALIAATASVHGMTVVTRNISDFAQSGVVVLNPWDTN